MWHFQWLYFNRWFLHMKVHHHSDLTSLWKRWCFAGQDLSHVDELRLDELHQACVSSNTEATWHGQEVDLEEGVSCKCLSKYLDTTSRWGSIHWSIIYQQYLHFRTSLTFVFDPRGECLDKCKGSSVRGFFLNQLRIPMYLHNSKIDKAWLNPFKSSSQDMACASSRVWSSWRGPRCKIWWFRFL